MEYSSSWFKFGSLAAVAGVIVVLWLAFTPKSNRSPEKVVGVEPRVATTPRMDPVRTGGAAQPSGPAVTLLPVETGAAGGLDPELAAAIQTFEDRVLSRGLAQRIRVETKFVPGFRSVAGSDPNRVLPGYVAFQMGPGGQQAGGVKGSMEEIAAEYFEQFPDAPSLRVSLVIGGRVAGGHTFHRNSGR